MPFLSVWQDPQALWPVLWGSPRKAEQRQKPLDIDVALCGQVHGAAERAGKPGLRWLRGSWLGNWIVSSFVRKSRRKDRLQEGGNSFSSRHVEFELPAGHSGGRRCCPISHIHPCCGLSCQCPHHHHLPQPNSLWRPSLSPGFYFPFQSRLCCWVNLLEHDCNRFPCRPGSTSRGTRYHLVTYYPTLCVTQDAPPQSHHRLP